MEFKRGVQLIGKWAGLGVTAVLAIGVLSFLGTQVYHQVKSYPVSTSAPDWASVGSEEIPVIQTVDDDGDRRITQLWIAEVDGVGYLRTSDSRWYANLHRDPRLLLRIGGQEYRCGTSFVADPALEGRVHEAFFAKYPQRSRMFRKLGVTTEHVIALTCGGNHV